MVKKARSNTLLDTVIMTLNNDIKQLCIKLPQMIGYVKCFDSNKTISFKVGDKKRILKRILTYVKKYIKILKRVRNLIKIEFDSELFMVIMINT